MAEDRGGREAGTGPRGRGSGSRPSGSRDYDDWEFEPPPRRREKGPPPAGSATEAAAVRPPNHRARRSLAIAGAAAVLVIAVILLLGSCGSPGQDAVRKYSEAWAKADWATMYAQLTPESQRKVSLIEFAQAGREALATATAPETAVRTAEPQASDNGLWRVPTTVRTRIFGTVRADTLLQVDTEGEEKKITWSPSQVFPGLRRGEQLTRETVMPARGTLLARDGTVLAKGPERSSPIPEVASQVVGEVGPVPPELTLETSALGYPPGAQVGISGLERIFNPQLGGLPSGVLKAGPRTLGRSSGSPGKTVRTTISPGLERVATAAVAGRDGGAVAMDPVSGAVLAFAGQAFSLLQPPGSTFKVITTAGALEDGVASLKSTYPFATRALLSGVPLSNAGGENCGGTLAEAFAESCNSVFAPMGAQLGSDRLVKIAERFGFNGAPILPGVAQSTIPRQLGDELDLGSTAIGQGKVQSSVLQMTDTAATIARGGRRPPVTLDLEQARRNTARSGEPAVSARTARTMRRLMAGVVSGGTGTAAAINGVTVAGKTGTAELRSREPGDTSSNPDDTTAWFIAFAPAAPGQTPRIAVGVMFVSAGAGGETAAPAAREILVEGLKER
ncbi:MAG: penicillin-binding transpeptidase domain-containing protein [Solirubrobacterales bacterium]